MLIKSFEDLKVIRSHNRKFTEVKSHGLLNRIAAKLYFMGV